MLKTWQEQLTEATDKHPWGLVVLLVVALGVFSVVTEGISHVIHGDVASCVCKCAGAD